MYLIFFISSKKYTPSVSQWVSFKVLAHRLRNKMKESLDIPFLPSSSEIFLSLIIRLL